MRTVVVLFTYWVVVSCCLGLAVGALAWTWAWATESKE